MDVDVFNLYSGRLLLRMSAAPLQREPLMPNSVRSILSADQQPFARF
jgi:hypothetical protein